MDKHEDVRFGSDYSTGRISNSEIIGFDLCVLAKSDHSIFSVGTFGMWGSLLAGGDVIVSKGKNDPIVTNATVTEEDKIFLKAALPNWLYIDTRNVNNITVLSVDPKSKHFIKSDQMIRK